MTRLSGEVESGLFSATSLALMSFYGARFLIGKSEK
jgi:hypothetical protein